MKINLYYVEGISRIDTPSFNTKTHIGTIEDQEEFFLTKLVRSIDTTFYPPYYHNSIKFDKEDLEITDNVNYLSLEYNGKTYYYFIDEINYTSTGIITLEVSMDTIQTFMFDIYISSGIIERKFINRWVDGFINRSYKRDNVSDGLFEVYTHNAISLPKENWFVVAKFVYVGEDNLYAVSSQVGINNDNVIYPSMIQFYPYKEGITIQKGGSSYTGSIRDYITGTSLDADLTDISIIPFSPFITSDYNPDTRELGSNLEVFTGVDLPNEIAYIYPKYTNKSGYSKTHRKAKVNSRIITETFNFTFESNNSVGVLYNSKYMPIMMDENYIQLIFGSRSSNTTAPLYKYNFQNLRLCYYANIIEGSRFYYISSSAVSSKEDKYRTLVGDMAPIKMDLMNDTYSVYDRTNKYRWAEAIGNTAVTASTLMISVALKSAFASKDIAKIAASSLTPKRHQLSKKGMRAIEAIKRSQRDEIPGDITKGVTSLMPIVGQAIQDSNMKYAPDNAKQLGTSNDIASYSYELFIEVQRVNDYEQCAQYYHRNGYLVQEYITQVSNIFNIIKNRYYFDVLKMSLPEVHLHNIIEDEDTIGLIEERLETGLRLWNVKNSDVIMGDFTYDNVELDYLS